MNEHKMSTRIHKDLQKRGKLTRVWKINDNFQGGVPDAFYLGASPLWIEYKHIEVPVRDSTMIRPNVSELQLGWLETLQAGGQGAWVVVTHGSGRTAMAWVESDLDVIRAGVTRGQFVQDSVTYAELLNDIEGACHEERT